MSVRTLKEISVSINGEEVDAKSVTIDDRGDSIAIALNVDEEDRANQKWTAGNRAAWSRILTLAARELSGEERSLAAALSELEDVRRGLRKLCADFGDNDWPDDLLLGHVIEKHLARHLHERLRPSVIEQHQPEWISGVMVFR